MPHFKVSDDAHAHPKVMMAGDAAWGMWNRAGCFSMAYGTDGFVPDWWVKQQPQGTTKAKKLVACQLWYRGKYTGDRPEYQGLTGYTFHEWRQDSYEKIQADREKWRQKKAGQRAASPPMSPGDKTGETARDSPGESRESPGYIPNTQYPNDFGYVPESATEPNGRDAAAATPGAELVRRTIPAELPAPVRTMLRISASTLIREGTPPDVVEQALRDWAAKTGVGPGILPSLAADVIKRRNGHARAAPVNGLTAGEAKVVGWAQLGEPNPDERKAIRG